MSDNADTSNWTVDDESTTVEEKIERIGRYRIKGCLGKGTFGRVFLAHDEQLDRLVAVKTPYKKRARSKLDVEEFLKESRVLAKLDHPAIVPVFDAGVTDEGLCYVVSKYIDGSNLATRIKDSSVPITRAVEWVASMAEALHHAHTRRLVHRDVKPANILLDRDDHAYLADFGIALREEDFGRGSHYAGTAYYMSPEQARGEGHLVDGRSDVFSLGVVLYLLLSGKRPFPGSKKTEILERIMTLEVRPPRQYNDQIPKELERICLHALAKRATDRYNTAQDMAVDLHEFQSTHRESALDGPAISARSDEGSLSAGYPIVPRGLRSFDTEDAEFFLKLLPGPYDRTGLPQSVRFWKTRIENVNSKEDFRAGLIYGPSGCGKSSLVKAGILPRLANNILDVLVDATPAGTESMLLKGVQRYCPDLAGHTDLAEALAAFRRGGARPSGGKLLIVIDQFEQWLHAHQEETDTGLCQALRQCDGEHVQCILLVRDDFWMSVTRFMRELEVRIVEGDNSCPVDCFDKRHARKVLAAFGRAYEALPQRVAETTADQARFLDRAVDELSHEGKVIPVQLVLFAEMIKSQPWSSETLHRVGGIQGIGARFLEETFSASTASPEHRLHEQSARAVLQALLPNRGTDIKGHMRSYHELLAASRSSNENAFRDLMRILDTELRLLTPVDVEPLQQEEGSGRTGEQVACCDHPEISAVETPVQLDVEAATEHRKTPSTYQLTHDYLVPALREWLTQKQRETRQGRAQLLLAERTELWTAKPERKQLPSLLEWLSIRRHVRRRDIAESQRRMLAVAKRTHLWRVALVLAILLATGIAVREGSRYLHAGNLVDRLLEAKTTEVPAIVRQMAPVRVWAERMLRQHSAEKDPHKRLHVSLGMLPGDESQMVYLQQRLLDGEPDEVSIIRDALAARRDYLVAGLWEELDSSESSSHRRLRAACALAAYDPEDEQWRNHSEDVARWLVDESPVVIAQWVSMLRPVQDVLLAPLTQLFASDRHERRFSAALVLTLCEGDNLRRLVELNRTSDEAQQGVLAGALRGQETPAIVLLVQELAADRPPGETEHERAAHARARSRAATMMMRLGHAAPVWRVLAESEDSQLRTCLIHEIAGAAVDPGILISQLKTGGAAPLQIGLLLSLGQYENTVLTGKHRNVLVPISLRLFEEDSHSGVHSAAEWLLQRLGYREEIATVRARLQAQRPDPARDWYETSQGQTMIVLRGDKSFQMGSPQEETGRKAVEPLHRVSLPYEFAISTKEVTLSQFRVFWRGFREQHENDSKLQYPVTYVDFVTAMVYCQWLSEVEGIPEDQWCYEHGPDGKLRPRADFQSWTGYRLPRETEWEYACRANTNTPRHDGYGLDFLGQYAWYRDNSDGRTHPVSSLKPNSFGLFDVHGNVGEWCQDKHDFDAAGELDLELTHPYRVVRGGSFSSVPDDVRSAHRAALYVKSGTAGTGFRVARMVTSSEVAAKAK